MAPESHTSSQRRRIQWLVVWSFQAVESGVWELPPTSLPDANTWPSWGALRERILTATKKISIVGSAAVRDAFLAELVKLSPPELHTLVRIYSTC